MPNSQMAKVALNNITKIYYLSNRRNIIAVKEVSFTVEDKEFVVLVGPSGSGKSTILRMIAGLEETTEGDIYIGDELVNNTEPRDRNIAMVFQNLALYSHMTVYKNMAFGLRLSKYPKEEISKRVADTAEILGITHLLDRKPKNLSGGERQRVAIGRAIVRQPKVFLFDEPLNELDAKLRVKMRTEIKRLHRKLQATIIYVTHDQMEAMTMGDRIIVLKEGMIKQIADPLTLYQRPANLFVAGFIGSPPTNFLEGNITGDDRDLFFQFDGFSIEVDTSMSIPIKQYPRKQVILGIRPEDIYIQGTSFGNKHNSSIPAQVDVIEPIGSEKLLYLTAGKHQLVAKVKSYISPIINSSLLITFDMRKASFFDRNSGDAIVDS